VKVKLKPLEASIFVTLDKLMQEDLLASHVVPVNDIFLPNWGNRNEINLYYGSYGSGKSVDIVDELIAKCLYDEYFRCYYGRKILENVRGSIFQTIIDRIVELKLGKYFEFSDKPNGSMVITCKLNNNKFIPFGANKSETLKSIKDPSHFFCDELDQFTFEDFGFFYSRLRTSKAFTQFYGSFNTEKIYKSHWIRRVLFDGEYKDLCYRLKANYYHNHFIDQEKYYRKLKLISNGNEVTLNAIANGEWGVIRTGEEFWKCFDDTKHVKEFNIAPTTIHVSLDQNVNPYVTQTIWQALPAIRVLRQVHEILSETPNNNAPKSAQQFITWLRSIGYNDVVFVYGDPSGKNKSVVDENSASFYDKYIQELKKAGFKVISRVGKSAPEVALSATFINAIYEHNEGGWSIEISAKCFQSIEDYMVVKEDAEGKMMKPKIKDKETLVTYEPAGHISDTKRYFITQILKKEWEEYKKLDTAPLNDKKGYFR